MRRLDRIEAALEGREAYLPLFREDDLRLLIDAARAYIDDLGLTPEGIAYVAGDDYISDPDPELDPEQEKRLIAGCKALAPLLAEEPE